MVDSQPRRIMRGREDFREGGFCFQPRWFVVNKLGFDVAWMVSNQAAKVEVWSKPLVAHTMRVVLLGASSWCTSCYFGLEEDMRLRIYS